MKNMNIFIPITKVDASKRLVYGTVTEEVPDKSNEILDYATAKGEFQKWSDSIAAASDGKSLGNVRAMHGNVAAGKLTDLAFDDEAKRIDCCAKVIDDVEWEKVLEGVYTGFSMGGRYLKRWPDPENPILTRYTPSPSEVSLVDNPCVPTATFAVIKQDGVIEMRKFTSVEGEAAQEQPTNKVTPDVEQVWKSKDGKTFATKREAVTHNEQLEIAAKTAPALEAVKNLESALSKVDGEKVEGEPEPTPAQTDEPKTEPVQPAEPTEPAKTDEPVTEPSQKVAPATLKKGMYQVSRMADLLESLCWLQASIADEAKWEGDNSTLPAQLQACIATLCEFLKNLVAEETSEIAGVKDAGKASDADPETGLAAKDDDAAMAAPAVMKKFEEANDLIKKLGTENSELQKTLASVTESLGSLTKRLQSLEAQPVAAKGYVRAVVKGNEISTSTGDNATGDDLAKALAALPESERVNVLMKAALATPKQAI